MVCKKFFIFLLHACKKFFNFYFLLYTPRHMPTRMRIVSVTDVCSYLGNGLHPSASVLSRVGTGEPMFESLPLTIREVKATEARLNAIYDAAKLGLKGDSLALAAGMLPAEYRQLCILDPVAEMAEQKGRADGERELSQVMHKAAREGDAKAALEILKHQHSWVAKQAVSVEVNQTISITAALQEAERRIINMGIIDETPASANSKGLLINNREKDGNDSTNSNARTPPLAARLRP